MQSLNADGLFFKKYLEDNAGNYPVFSSQTERNGEIGKINTFDFDGEFLTWTTDVVKLALFFIAMVSYNTNQLNYKFAYCWLLVEAKKYVNNGMVNQ